MRKVIPALLIVILMSLCILFTGCINTNNTNGPSNQTPTMGVEYTISGDGTYATVTGCRISETDVVISAVFRGLPVTSISAHAFEYCTNLTSVTMPGSITAIDSSAFYGCTSLTNITIPDGVTTIGSYAFSGCYNLASVAIPESVTSIGNCAFYNCSLTAINYSGTKSQWNVISKGYDWDFSTCNYTVIYGRTNTENDGAVVGTAGIEYTTYGTYAAVTGFSGTATDVIISSYYNGVPVTSISDYAFYCCYRLASVTIPDSVTSIGNSAFYNCTKLTTINYRGTKSQWNSISKGANWDYSTDDYAIIYRYQD